MELTLEQAQERVKFLESENSTLKKLASSLNETIESQKEELNKFSSFISVEDAELASESMKELEEMKKLGTKEDIQEKLDMLKSFEQFGSLEEVEKAHSILESLSAIGAVSDFENAVKELESFKRFGTLEEVESAHSLLESLSTLGSVEFIKESVETAKALEEYGSIEQVGKAVSFLEEYSSFGSVKDVESAVQLQKMIADLGHTNESIEEMLKQKEISEHKAIIDSLCDKYFVPAEVAEETYRLHNESYENTCKYFDMLKPHRSSVKVSESFNPSKVDVIASSIGVANESVNKKPQKRATLLKQFK